MTIPEIKQLCRNYNIQPSKFKGQNFLLCDEAIDKTVKAGDIKSGDIILEAGPGFGVLTKELAKMAGHVIAVELDDNLFHASNKIFKDAKNVEVIKNDILRFSYEELAAKISGEYKIISNLPYSITGVFLRRFLSMEKKPSLMVLMLQKEVAQRICAASGDMSILSVSAQYYSYPEIISYAPKECFYPVPEVDSAIVKFDIRKENVNKEEEKKIFQMARIGFSARRKMLKNNLFNGLKGTIKGISMENIEKILLKCGLDIKIRAQDLSVENWKKLAACF